MSQRLTSEHSCKNKITYNSKRKAERAISVLGKRYTTGKSSLIGAYKCNICNKWHLGHKVRNLDLIFDQIKEKR